MELIVCLYRHDATYMDNISWTEDVVGNCCPFFQLALVYSTKTNIANYILHSVYNDVCKKKKNYRK